MGSIPIFLVFFLFFFVLLEKFFIEINFFFFFMLSFFSKYTPNFIKKKYLFWSDFKFFLTPIVVYCFYYYLVSNLKKSFFFFNYLNKTKITQLSQLFKSNINFFIIKRSFVFFFFLVFNLMFILCFFYLYEHAPLLKIFFAWGSIGFFVYILVSGFVFFGKRYNFNKYTAAISRFWKRSFSLFWLLEAFIFLIFIYLTLNSSSEVYYSFELSSLKKYYLVSWKNYSFKIFIIVLLIFFFFLLSLVSYDNDRFFFFFISLFISLLSIYLLWTEFNQFLHFLNHSNHYIWNLNLDSLEFTLESELRRSKVFKNFILVCVVAKFWHLVFIIFFWFFNFNRSFEQKDQKDFLLSFSFQNYIILYILNWISMYAWFKRYFRGYLNLTFYWFYSNFNLNFFNNFFYAIFDIFC